MAEYFVVANSYAAPFFSDTSKEFIKGDDPDTALAKFVADYSHPAGLFAAIIFESANAYHRGEKALARWLSEKAVKEETT